MLQTDISYSFKQQCCQAAPFWRRRLLAVPWAVFRIRIRIIGGLLDPDPHLSMRIRIQEVKSSQIKLKIAATYISKKKT